MLKYDEEFKDAVLTIFGNSDDIRGMLDNGSEIIGRILDDSRYGAGPSSEAIVNAFEAPEEERAAALSEIYKKAKRQVAIKELYVQWSKIDSEQHELGGRSK